MALRNLEFTALLYQELARRGELGQPGRWPPVLPIVLYNGDAPWTAALEMRELIAEVTAALSPYQPSQRSLVLDERHASVDHLPLRNLTRADDQFPHCCEVIVCLSPPRSVDARSHGEVTRRAQAA